jgi:hypothetical protein
MGALVLGVALRLVDFAFRSSALEPFVGATTAFAILFGLSSPICGAFLKVVVHPNRTVRLVVLMLLAALEVAVAAVAALVLLVIARPFLGA